MECFAELRGQASNRRSYIDMEELVMGFVVM